MKTQKLGSKKEYDRRRKTPRQGEQPEWEHNGSNSEVTLPESPTLGYKTGEGSTVDDVRNGKTFSKTKKGRTEDEDP